MKKALAMASFICMFGSEVFAGYIYWLGVGGSYTGNFEVASNWDVGIPGADDWVCFKNTTAKNWEVMFNSDVTNLTFLSDTDALNFETRFVLNQHAWTAVDQFYFRKGVGGRVTFTNGTLRTKSLHCYPDTTVSPLYMALAMKDVVCEANNASIAACDVVFEGGKVQLSDDLVVGLPAYGKATVRLNRGVQCGVKNAFRMGSATGSTGEVVNINGVLHHEGLTNACSIGKAGCGTFLIQGGTTVIAHSPTIGADSTGVGHMTVSDGSNTFGTVSGDRIHVGDLGAGALLAGGGTNVTVAISLGSSAGGVGDMSLTNGFWTIAEHMWVGFFGTGALSVSGGEMHFLSYGPVLAVARNASSTGAVTVSGGLLNQNGAVWMGGGANAQARLTLSGSGILRTKTIQEKDPTATSQAVFDGGKLQAAASGTLIQPLDDVRLTTNGLVVDTDGYAVSVMPALQDATGEAGGITKWGAGTLTLAGARLATGPVSVLGGTLVVSNNVTVWAGTSRIDGTLALTAANRLTVGAGAALAGTGSVARVTLADNAKLVRSKTDGATSPLNVSDCFASGALTVDISGYTRTDLLAALPLLKVPSASFVKPSFVSVLRDGVSAPAVVVRYSEDGGATVLSVVYNSGTMISVR